MRGLLLLVAARAAEASPAAVLVGDGGVRQLVGGDVVGGREKPLDGVAHEPAQPRTNRSERELT